VRRLEESSMNRALLLTAVMGLGTWAGCTEATRVTAQQQRVIQDTDPDEVLTAAAAILQREFGRVTIDRAARRITTVPVEYTTQRESGTARDLYRGRSTMRRVAQFDVGRNAGQTVARIRVDIERRDTERQAMIQPRAYRLSDDPGQETPIDADAATSSRQNAVWTRVRRDRTLERELLDELRDQFARLAAPSEQPPSTAPAAMTAPTQKEE
jgi:hypothetical protein